MATKKASKKKPTKTTKATAKKVATKKIKAAVKKAVTKKVATKKATRKVASKSSKSTKATATRRSITKTSTKATKTASTRRTKALVPTGPVIEGTPLELFKVVARRSNPNRRSKQTTILTSVFAKGNLRAVFDETGEEFTNQVDPNLPMTGFSTHYAAEQWIRRNRHKQVATWVIVKGVGVPAVNPPARPMLIRKGVMAEIGSLTGNELVSAVQRAASDAIGRRGRRLKWASGTVFVQNFKITSIVREVTPLPR